MCTYIYEMHCVSSLLVWVTMGYQGLPGVTMGLFGSNNQVALIDCQLKIGGICTRYCTRKDKNIGLAANTCQCYICT